MRVSYVFWYNGYMNLNKVTLIGRLTGDPELKTTPTGKEVCSFSLATNQTWKDQSGQKQEKTDFHNIVAWGNQASTIAQYCMKGQEMYIEGKLETRSWDDSDGKKNYRTEVKLDRFEFGQKPNAAGGSNNYSENKSSGTPAKESAPAAIDYPSDEIDPDDIPF